MTCFADPNPTFQRALRIITAITNANPASITTSFAHQYKTGLIVRIVVPVSDGMQQINGQTGTITVTSPTTFNIDIDSTNFDSFAVPGMATQCAQVIPIAEINSILTEATQNVLNNT